MAHMQPDVVVSTGVAGGIDEKAGVMEVVAASEVVYHDVWCGNGNESDKYKICRPGLFVTGVCFPYAVL